MYDYGVCFYQFPMLLLMVHWLQLPNWKLNAFFRVTFALLYHVRRIQQNYYVERSYMFLQDILT